MSSVVASIWIISVTTHYDVLCILVTTTVSSGDWITPKEKKERETANVLKQTFYREETISFGRDFSTLQVRPPRP